MKIVCKFARFSNILEAWLSVHVPVCATAIVAVGGGGRGRKGKWCFENEMASVSMRAVSCTQCCQWDRRQEVQIFSNMCLEPCCCCCCWCNHDGPVPGFVITGLLSACCSVSGWDHHLHIVTVAGDYDHCDSMARVCDCWCLRAPRRPSMWRMLPGWPPPGGPGHTPPASHNLLS